MESGREVTNVEGSNRSRVFIGIDVLFRSRNTRWQVVYARNWMQPSSIDPFDDVKTQSKS